MRIRAASGGDKDRLPPVDGLNTAGAVYRRDWLLVNQWRANESMMLHTEWGGGGLGKTTSTQMFKDEKNILILLITFGVAD